MNGWCGIYIVNTRNVEGHDVISSYSPFEYKRS
jgi:hypothetical protein